MPGVLAAYERKLRQVCLPLLCTLLAGSSAAAAPPPHADDRDKRWHATRTDAPPRIDGRLDDAAWAHAPAESRFTQHFPDEARPPSQPTELRVLYDDTTLYIGVRCFDAQPGAIVERLSRRDRETDADKITIDISSKNDRNTAYHFDVNAAGVLVDGMRFSDKDYSDAWDGLWLGAAHRDAGGWSAELAIPFKTLRYAGGTTEFGFQVRRYLQRRQEVDEWAFIPRSTGGEVSYYGTLDGLTGLRATHLFQILPYLVSKAVLRSNQAPLDGTTFGATVGADIKIGITPALTLDATFNPDFGQVEADQVVLNLTTFEIFFPEKRPFFLEGADIFRVPGPFAMLYSRRIGHAPAGLPTDSPYTLAEPSPDGRILGAAKLTGVIAPRLTIGLLDALTDSAALVVTRGAARSALVAEPLTNYAALHLRRDVLKNSYIGLMATAVTRFERPFEAAPSPSDLCPDDDVPSRGGRCFHDGYAGAVDGALRSPDGNWEAEWVAAGSLRANGPHRTLVDGTEIGPGASGLGIHISGEKQGGALALFATYEGYSPAFDINDMGFNQQANLHRGAADAGYRMLKPHGIVLEGEITAGFDVHATWDGRAILLREGYLSTWWRFRGFWRLDLSLNYNLAHDDVREARDGARVERAGGWAFFYTLKSDPRRRVVFQLNGQAARVRHGFNIEANATLSLRLLPALEIDLIPHVVWGAGDPRWFDTLDRGGGMHSYYFADLESQDLDITLRGTYTFTPTLSLQAYAQLFVDGGHYGQTYLATVAGPRPALPWSAFQPVGRRPPQLTNPDFRSGNINVNLVLRWELTPGSTLLAVYTHASQQVTYDPIEGNGRPNFARFRAGPGVDILLLKLSVLIN